MKYHLIIKPDAELDLLDSVRWYENQREGLGQRFLVAFEDKLQLVARDPLHYQIRYKSTRFALVKRFP